MLQCVFCDATVNLNTQLTVTLDDGSKISVLICDAHADDATVKTAKAAYIVKQDKIKVVIEQARALGLNVTGMEQHGRILVPTVTVAAKSPPPIEQSIEPVELSGEQVINTEMLDRRSMQSVGGATTDFGHVASHSSYDFNDLQSKLPDEARKGKAKMAMVEAREGMPIAIPETRVDGTGTTRIRVLKKEDDTKLQQRFKKMADDSMRDKTPNFARAGYQNTQAVCPICQGSCAIRQNVGGAMKEVTCPKCGGAGLISIS